MALLIDFLSLLGLVVGAVTVVMLLTGLFFEVMNAQHPERRIQKNRVNRRKWKELRRAPVSILTLSVCFAFGLFAQRQGWSLVPLELTWWSGPLMLLLSVVLYDAWFYWVHRLLHNRVFYRFHALHHKSVAPTVWSNHHESFVEALLNQAYYAIIVFVLPIPWQMLVLQKIYDQVSGMLGHAGYEHFASPAGRSPWPLASTVFHDQHHGSFMFNYGHTFSLWDRWMGTIHPGYDNTLKSFEAIEQLPETAGPGSSESH